MEQLRSTAWNINETTGINSNGLKTYKDGESNYIDVEMLYKKYSRH
jgi:hypothetical protein